eukprot:10574564-Ditylum_brightwellii.AAC.1
MAKFRSAPGCTKYVVNCTLQEHQIGIVGQEFILFPSTMVSDDKSLADIEGPIIISDGVEGIHPSNEIVHKGNDQNTTSVTSQQGSFNENATLSTITIKTRDAPHTANEENLYIFKRNHPPPVQLIPQEKEDLIAAISNQAELIRLHN